MKLAVLIILYWIPSQSSIYIYIYIFFLFPLHRVFSLSKSLIKLIVSTFLSFNVYYLKEKNFWECNYGGLTHGNISFLVCNVTSFDFMRNIWLNGCIHLTINLQLVKFHAYRSCQRGYVTLLDFSCHVTRHYHVLRGSCDSLGGFLSSYVPNLPCLVFIDLAEGEI